MSTDERPADAVQPELDPTVRVRGVNRDPELHGTRARHEVHARVLYPVAVIEVADMRAGVDDALHRVIRFGLQCRERTDQGVPPRPCGIK